MSARRPAAFRSFRARKSRQRKPAPVLNREELLRTRCALRAHELAALLGVSRASVSRALARGELKGVTVAGVLVLPLHELQRVGLFPGDPSGDSEATAAENPRPGADSSGSASVSDAKDDSGRG